MNAVMETEVEFVDETPFFAPASTDMLDGLLGQYQSQRRRIESVAVFIEDPDTLPAMHYFIEGNQNRDRSTPTASQLFCLKGAVAALNSAFWSKALGLTDVLDMMPQARRTEWHTTIREQTAPDFEEETVRNTITELPNRRSKFLAERVDGIFRGLSGEHVTNAPEAFGKRMIIANALSSYGYAESSRTGLINDLRCVIAKFMGRDEPQYWASDKLAKLDLLPEYDHINTWPVRRRIRPAHTWGIRTPGQRRAQPFDRLLA
jgi:hypothetical protein